MRYRLLSFLAGGLLALTSCAASPPTDARAERSLGYFQGADRNGSGVLEPGEINAAVMGEFGRLDVSGDALVTLKDVYNDRQGRPEGAAQTLRLSHHLPFDADGDGAITQAEHRAHLQNSMIGPTDADGDGSISLDEYRDFRDF